jgi:hypothetical protein
MKQNARSTKISVEAPGIDPGTSRMLWIFLLAKAYRFTIMQTRKYDVNLRQK